MYDEYAVNEVVAFSLREVNDQESAASSWACSEPYNRDWKYLARLVYVDFT